ncbi:melibiose:sodium transporter MelB [Vibrio mangrovi]|uniref:Melibiose carrier protein n=1 Tax=Vibrio mangrovi TaxID=474394 RepID=A0A1Y6IWA0_9VIBR|nr:melibiose:sodium transporter MelB [Vibrio mangrovi]MDW6004818.1 melibiose:sodium transporter MelB [Vibrio mangrovi]SMS01110.1 Melibiose carrier protein [Vibrio mangrovi]
MNKTQNETHIELKTKLSYGLGALGKDFACAPIYIFLMFYFTDVVELSAAYVGTVFLAARIIDALTDPMMGIVVDNTRSRYGKFRPWILIGSAVNAFVLVALFCTHMFEGTAAYVYAAVIYILWGLTYTIMDIPFWSMIPAISDSRREREKLVVWPRLFASLAWFVVGSYGLLIVTKLGQGEQGRGFFLFSVLIAVLFIISALITFKNVKEKVVATERTTEKFGLKDALTIIGGNDQLKVLIVTLLAFQIGNMLVGGFAIYYFTYALGNKELFPIYMMFAGGAEVAGIFLFPRLAALLPRKNLWVIACGFPILSCLLLVVMFIAAPGNVFLIGLSGAAIKFGVGIINGLQTVMLADVVDYGEYISGRRSESVIFSVQTMLVKFAGAAGAFIVGVGLAVIGYVPNAEQSAETIFGLQALMIGIPILLMLFSAVIYKRYYKLHEGFHQPASDLYPLETAKETTA